jgi:hypothetical protein
VEATAPSPAPATDTVVEAQDARWPFAAVRSTRADRPACGSRTAITLVIDGLDAAQFILRMEMANLTATGVFDGRLPAIFDATGGTSWAARSPRAGGNVSYVGALTYKDLSAMANAFRALRSLDYRSMTIAMRGDTRAISSPRSSLPGSAGQGRLRIS